MSETLLVVTMTEVDREAICTAAAHAGASVSDWSREVLLRAARRVQEEADAAIRYAAQLEQVKLWLAKPETPATKARREKESRDWEAGKILSAAKVAKLLRLSAPTVIRLMKDGTIPARGQSTGHVTLWFCHRADIDAMFRHPKLKFRSRLRG